jgi:4a-hydroxytetrahydrobiopterin dehydratase
MNARTPAQRLDDEEISRALESLAGWTREGDVLVRTYEFARFMDGIGFVNRVAAAAEEMDHHPDLDVRFTRIRVALSTHSAGGITQLDAELAGRIDAAAAAGG